MKAHRAGVDNSTREKGTRDAKRRPHLNTYTNLHTKTIKSLRMKVIYHEILFNSNLIGIK